MDPLAIASGMVQGDSGFDTRKLASIRSGKWKLMTGPIQYNYLIPDPVTEPKLCE